MRVKFSENEIEIIKKRLAENFSVEHIAFELGRTVGSVNAKIHYNGLRVEKIKKDWTLGEERQLKKMVKNKMTDRKIAEILGRSVFSVIHKRAKINLTKNEPILDSCKAFVKSNLDKNIDFILENTKLNKQQAIRLKYRYEREKRGYALNTKKLTSDDIEHMIKLKKNGFSYTQISQIYGCSCSLVSRTFAKERLKMED